MCPDTWTELEISIDNIIRRHVILAGGGGNIADAIAQWRGEDDLVEANRVLDALVEKIAQFVRR